MNLFEIIKSNSQVLPGNRLNSEELQKLFNEMRTANFASPAGIFGGKVGFNRTQMLAMISHFGLHRIVPIDSEDYEFLVQFAQESNTKLSQLQTVGMTNKKITSALFNRS